MGNVSFTKAIAKGKKLAFDSDALIYFFEGRAPWDTLVAEAIQVMEDGKATLILSSLSYAEVLSGYYQAGASEAAKEFNRFLFQLPKCEIVAVDAAIADHAAQLRAKYRLKLPDAVQLAVMEHSKSDVLITNDKDFRKVKDMDILLLDDFV